MLLFHVSVSTDKIVLNAQRKEVCHHQKEDFFAIDVVLMIDKER